MPVAAATAAIALPRRAPRRSRSDESAVAVISATTACVARTPWRAGSCG